MNIHALGQTVWGHIWKHTVEKSQTNATNVTLHPLRQAIWRNTWTCTVGKSQTNVTNVTLHPFRQAIWGNTWKCTVEKKAKQMQPMWLCIFSGRQFEDAHAIQKSRKIPVFYFQKSRYRYLSPIPVYRYFPVYRRGLVTRPEQPKGAKDDVKQVRRAANWKSGPGGAPRLLVFPYFFMFPYCCSYFH